jgi:elongation factor Ts
MSIKASDVNNLRQMTGAGMMDCKKALEEAGGDFDKAVEILRIKGQKVSVSRQDRDAKEGTVFAKTAPDNSYGVMFELNSETDFVAKNEDFLTTGEKIITKALAVKPANLEALLAMEVESGKTAQDLIVDLVTKIREKIEISRYALVTGEYVSLYVHTGSKIGVLVAFQNVGGTDLAILGKDVAMQIAAMKPVAVRRDEVDASLIDREVEIAKEQARAEGKPENMIEKIATGKVQKFYKEQVLLEQEFVKDNSKSVEQYIKDHNKDIKVVSFTRFGIGDN